MTDASGIVVLIDGKSCAGPEARVSVFDRGFLYGDSVFETIRTYGGRPFALDEHLARLWRSAELVFIPAPCSRDTLRGEVQSALGSAGNEESYIRVMITRGQGELGLDPNLAQLPLRVIIVGPLHPPRPEVYETGAGAITFRTLRPSDATIAEGAKIGNYLVAVLAMREAKAASANEALIVDRDGHVVEGASSNVFIVRDGVLITPPLEAGILAGVTRERALRAAVLLGVPVSFELPTVAEVTSASEVFISSSIRELLPIVSVDGVGIGTGSVGEVTRALREAFRQVIATEMAQG